MKIDNTGYQSVEPCMTCSTIVLDKGLWGQSMNEMVHLTWCFSSSLVNCPAVVGHGRLVN